MNTIPKSIVRLIEEFSRFPGIGRKTAQRMAFHVLKAPNDQAVQLSQSIMDMKTKISIWNTLRKEDALKAISTGNAKLYFTPRDVNLSIENHDHTHDSGSSWVDGVQSTDE